MIRLYNMVFVLTVLSIVTVFPAFAQQGEEAKAVAQSDASSAVMPAVSAKEDATQLKSLNIYGEIQSVDAGAGSMTVQYYDYDTDEEKVISLSLSKDSKIENVAGLSEIKKGDWADITYQSEGDKNMVTSIMVEKEEEIPVETMPEGETVE